MVSKFRTNFLYTMLHSIINVIVPFIITPYVARILGAENVGIYSYSYSVAYYFVIVIMMGLNNYGNRTIAESRDNKEKESKTFWDIYYMQVGIAVISISVYLVYSLTLSNYKLISILLIGYVLSAAFDITWYFYGTEQFRSIFIRNLIIKLADLILIVLFVKKETDLWIYTLIMSIGLLASQLILWTQIWKMVGVRRVEWKDSIKHLKPNLILFIPVIAISIYNMMDKIMLGNMSNMSEVGYYDNAEKIINIPQMVVAALGTVMLPRVTNMLAKGDNKAVTGYLKKSIVFVGFVSSACTFGIITVAKEFIALYLGAGYEKCVILLYFLMPCLIFKAFANVLRTQYLIPRKNDRVYVNSVLFGALINFIFNLIFIRFYSSIGACIGTIAAEILVCSYQLEYVNKNEKVIIPVFIAMGFQVCGMVMFFTVSSLRIDMGLNFLTFFTKVVVGGIVYLTISFVYMAFVNKKTGNIYFISRKHKGQ